MSTEEKKEKSQRKGIQSIVTGFKILDYLLSRGKPVPLREISKGTGLAPNKLQFYLISLMEVKVVHQDSRSGYYGLGPYTLQLGIAGLQQFDIFDAARWRLDEFAEQHGHNVFMGVWGNQGPTIIHRVSGRHRTSLLELRLGSVLPVLRSALGRALFAFLPDAVTSSYVEREMGEAMHSSVGLDQEMPRNVAALKALRKEIQERRISRCRGGLLSDHTALSAPIFDYRGKIIAAVTAMGPVNSLDDDFDGPIATDLKRIAEEISQEAGLTTTHYLEI